MKNSNLMNSAPRHAVPLIKAVLAAAFAIFFATSVDAAEVAGASADAALTGLIQTRPHPIAVIEIGGKQKIYTIGDALPGGFIIKRIESDRVILTQSGRDTILYFGGTLAARTQTEREPSAKPNVEAVISAVARSNGAASPERPGTASLRGAPGPISASWIVPTWLQNGLSGPVSMDEVKKSPWAKN
jgi:hypothetical protein